MLATIDDLAAYLGKSVANETQAELALSIASDVIRAEAGQTISYVENDVVTLDATSSTTLYLPERPVVAVSSVVSEGLRAGEWAFTVDRLTRVGGWPQAVTVTYSHGFERIPDDVRGICLAMATRLIGSQTGESAIVGETIGSYRIEYARSVDASRTGMLDVERSHIRRTYRRTAGMFSLR